MRERIHALFSVRKDQTVDTYPRLGHLGGADLLVGLEQAVREGRLKRGRTLLAASANNAFGAVVLDGDMDGEIAVPPR
jgi:3-oxoacyl-[acyl-carrier-protein] synthase III